MAFTFGFYADPALTTRIPSPLVFVQAAAAPTPAVRPIWFGSPDAAATCKAASVPGVDPIVITPVDAASGSGSPATDIKLALSLAGLSTATPGAALTLPHTVAGGASNAVAIYISVLDSTHVGGVNADLSLTTNEMVQS